ncbi:hypothetical protein Pint_33039 [Pistacia integerrima]|uniref:Uncharacterized protein n=1 Tax=Pistacia integerrima TaxID=434235 RepID=A0ACC0X717_9ROSI|nr:hypothetical protein Pint_33039 [Pistacia integerrima]
MTWIGQRPAMTCEFAKRCGFSTRRHRTEGKDGVGKGLTRRYFVCHRAEYMRKSKITELGAPEWRVTANGEAHGTLECVEPGYLSFTEKDVRNLLQSFRKLDPEDEKNIAWSYASSIQAYEIFGDAVVFYATHCLTALDMPLGIWVGVNNYGVPCFFGCALLREENLRSLSWALKVID